ncbi:hypothetical protein C0991_001244 [Blastosporella zonata]|nr:hypothetical protein C0991_001244 [Blastosporella zonata]
MSRATGTFHKPSPFQFPRAPLSPPDTNVDAIGPSLMPYTATHLGSHELRPNETELPHARSAPAPGDAAAARFKKISSIAYQSSGIKESRERTPQRAPRGFVIIIPPNSLIQEHGQLGNTLASGPRHRLSNGLLMPLFPTMFGQLTAIAREFNFPSTAGLCLYPHFVENGVTATPRISDEYWPFIWAHAFEASPASKSLISGKIEFDFDLRQARWYTSWLASSHRDNIEHPITILSSAAPAFVHNRADSKTTFPEDDQEEIRSIGTTTRHVPRKLSLVDRYDILSVRSGSRPASRSGLSPPEHPYPSSRVLSPIFQDEEPKSARHDLDHRVNSWRSSAILQSTPMAAVRQQPATSVSTDENVQDGPLKLEDFAWSVTSAGPDDYDTLSLVSWDRVPSVHIANRVEGSVCLTQSDRTSFGPSDYTLPSPEPSHYRLPSPDLAYRMLEDAPLTPSTATSWGAPLEFPSSPVYLSRPPSVDLGERAVFSRPVTPATATSWGPSSCPPSPIYTEYTSRSIHLGDRGDFSRPVTPSTATSWGAPLSYPPSPVTPFYVSSPDAGHRGFEDTDIEPGMPDPFGPGNACAVETSIKQNLSGTPWGHSWPYRSKRSYQNETRPKLPTIPWKHFWPYRNVTSCAPQIVVEAKANASFGYPLFVLCQYLLIIQGIYMRLTFPQTRRCTPILTCIQQMLFRLTLLNLQGVL